MWGMAGLLAPQGHEDKDAYCPCHEGERYADHNAADGAQRVSLWQGVTGVVFVWLWTLEACLPGGRGCLGCAAGAGVPRGEGEWLATSATGVGVCAGERGNDDVVQAEHRGCPCWLAGNDASGDEGVSRGFMDFFLLT